MKTKAVIKLGILATMFLILATGAATQKIRYNFAPGTDFSKYKTYRWVRIEKAQYPSQLIDDQIMRSIDSQLSLKGLRKEDVEKPDLVVVYQVALRQEREWTSYNTGGGWGWGGWGGWGGYGGGSTYGSTSTITIGSLDLDFYDVATKKQVWRGEATKTLDPPKDPNKLNQKIDKAMAKLLKNYPPPVKKK